MLLIKIISLNLFWYFCVSIGPKVDDLYPPVMAICICILNYVYFRPKLEVSQYFIFALMLTLYGFIQDQLLYKFGLVDYKQNYVPLWLVSLYIVFISYYNDVFSKILKLSWVQTFVIGGVGGSLSYYGGVQLSGISVLTNHYYILIFFSWAILFSVSLKIYNNLISRNREDEY